MHTLTHTRFVNHTVPISPKDEETHKSNESNEVISLSRKSNFAAAIFRLNGMELGHVIRTMELECPEALEDLADNQVEINVDQMPAAIFLQLETYLEQTVPNKRRKK